MGTKKGVRKMRAKKTYSLDQLVDTNIDAWVMAMSALDDVKGFRREALVLADAKTIAQWKMNDRCPAELEAEFTTVANRHNYRFDRNGKIVSSDKTAKLKANGRK